MNENVLNQEFIVTLNFSDVLRSLRDNKKVVDTALKCKNYSNSVSASAMILRDSFEAKIFKFKSKEEMQVVFEEESYSSATIFELLPLLAQFPDLKELCLAATGSYTTVEFGDHFHVVHNGNKDDISLSFYCFSNCCFEVRMGENFYVLGIKN